MRPGLEAAAPSPPQWRHAALPSRLTPEDVERVLAVYQDGTPSSLHNRAMRMLLARLGLRTQAVISLCLEDIDWADGRLDLRPGIASHIFRHTAASQMLNHGASFTEVADVLGHQS